MKKRLLAVTILAGLCGAQAAFAQKPIRIGVLNDQSGANVIADVPNSAIALAINQLVRDRNKVFLGSIRADSRKTHPVFLLETKTLAEGKGEWDLFKQVGVVPADQAFRPLKDGHCPLVSG